MQQDSVENAEYGSVHPNPEGKREQRDRGERRAAPKTAPPVAPPNTGVTVEVYQGDKKLPDVKFPDEGSDTK